MRKLVDAPRKKKQWTEKEEAYLQDKWGTVSIKGLSKALGRSENAIIVRAQRLGCGAHLAGDTRISLNQLMLAIYGKNMLGYTSDRLNRTALATRGKYERLQNPEYNKRYNRGQNEDYEYQGIRSISGKDILKDRELMDGAEFQELEPVANK